MMWLFVSLILKSIKEPNDIYFHFDLFEWNFAFSNENVPFEKAIQGVSRHQNSINFKDEVIDRDRPCQ